MNSPTQTKAIIQARLAAAVGYLELARKQITTGAIIEAGNAVQCATNEVQQASAEHARWTP